jgi:hypothetical protein
MNERHARAVLRELGIKNPSPSLIENYLRVEDADNNEGVGGSERVIVTPCEPTTSEPIAAREESDQPAHTSKSRLFPILRESGELIRPPGPRRPGRPRIVAGFFERLADAMKDGTSLKSALVICGINGLCKSERRALYRNRAFREMYQEARRKFLVEHYGKRPTLRAKLGRYL